MRISGGRLWAFLPCMEEYRASCNSTIATNRAVPGKSIILSFRNNLHLLPGQALLNCWSTLSGMTAYREEKLMETITASEAEKRVWKVVDMIEQIMNREDRPPSEQEDTWREGLASTIFSLFAEEYN